MFASILLHFSRPTVARRVRFANGDQVVQLADDNAIPTAEDFEQEDAEMRRAAVAEAHQGLESVANWLIELLEQSAPDEALVPTLGVLVGCLNKGGPPAAIERAAYALRVLCLLYTSPSPRDS